MLYFLGSGLSCLFAWRPLAAWPADSHFRVFRKYIPSIEGGGSGRVTWHMAWQAQEACGPLCHTWRGMCIVGMVPQRHGGRNSAVHPISQYQGLCAIRQSTDGAEKKLKL